GPPPRVGNSSFFTKGIPPCAEEKVSAWTMLPGRPFSMSSPAVSTPTFSSQLAGKYLTVALDNESYGVAVLKVREIIRMQKITPVPQMPEFVKGVINLRGRVIPVIDL